MLRKRDVKEVWHKIRFIPLLDPVEGFLSILVMEQVRQKDEDLYRKGKCMQRLNDSMRVMHREGLTMFLMNVT